MLPMPCASTSKLIFRVDINIATSGTMIGGWVVTQNITRMTQDIPLMFRKMIFSA